MVPNMQTGRCFASETTIYIYICIPNACNQFRNMSCHLPFSRFLRWTCFYVLQEMPLSGWAMLKSLAKRYSIITIMDHVWNFTGVVNITFADPQPDNAVSSPKWQHLRSNWSNPCPNPWDSHLQHHQDHLQVQR